MLPTLCPVMDSTTFQMVWYVSKEQLEHVLGKLLWGSSCAFKCSNTAVQRIVRFHKMDLEELGKMWRKSHRQILGFLWWVVGIELREMWSCKKLRKYGCQDFKKCWGVRQKGNVKINPRVLVVKLNGWCFRSAGMKRARWTLISTDAETRVNLLVMLHPVDLGITRSHPDLPQQKHALTNDVAWVEEGPESQS